MNLKLPLLGKIAIGEETQSPAIVQIEDKESKDKLVDILGGFLSFAKTGLSNEKSISKKLLKANREWVYRNNDVIANEISKLEFELFTISLRDGEIVFDEILSHPLLDLLDRFNPSTTKSDGIYTTQSHKKITGDAFWLLDKQNKIPTNIYILPPDKVELRLGDPTDATANLIEGYFYSDTIDEKKIEKTYNPDEIIHFKKPNPDNPFRGLGVVEAIAETIDSDNLSNLTQKNFFDKGAISNFVLTTDKKITQDQLKRMRAELRAMYTGAKNAFTTMIFGNGLKPAPIGFSNKDMQFLDILEWYRDKIMVGFGNTKASLGIVEDVNRASFEGAYQGWLQSTVEPDMSAIVNTINEFLVPMFDEKLILGYKSPVPEDITADIQMSVQLKNSGVITINEARQKVGYDAVEGGDIFAPSGNVLTPDNPNNSNNPSNGNNQDNSGQDNNNQDNGNKHFYRKANKHPHIKNLPSGLKNVNIDSVLRRNKIYYTQKINHDFKEAAKPMIRKMFLKKDSGQLSEQALSTYYEKQMYIADSLEQQFREKIVDLLSKVQEQTLDNFENEIKTIRKLKNFMVKKQLFDEEALKVQAQIDLFPILLEEIALAGQEAYRLIGVEDTYIPFNIKDSVKAIVDKFATSMLDTDKNVLSQIIADAIDNGDSIPEITNKIKTEFGQYKETQATRIARTETIRVSNMAAEDAFIQSGVVEAKQWLVAPGAEKRCLQYAGKIVKLNNNFYRPDTSGFQDGNPPLHVNCRCVLVPIVAGTRSYRGRKNK